MSYLVGVLVILGGLLVSIALHEVGHMVPAKKFGVRVSQYMVGFGPTLWSRTRGETEYGLKAIPLGGYVRLVGMYPPGDPRAERKTGRIAELIQSARDASTERREQSFVGARLCQHRHGHQEADDLREGSEVVRHAQNLPDGAAVGSAMRMSRPGGRGVPRGASRKVRTPQSDGGG